MSLKANTLPKEAQAPASEFVHPVMAYDYMDKRDIGILISEEQSSRIAEVAQMRKELVRRQQRMAHGSISRQRAWTDANGGSWSYIVLDDSYVRIERYAGEERLLRIPAQVEGLPVIALGVDALAFNESVEAIHCPDCISSIGSGAFRGDESLRKLVLPASTQDFDPGWIERCASLEDLVLPGLLERIARGVVSSGRLRRLRVGASVREIEPGAFQGSTLREIVVDESNPFITTDGTAVYDKAMTTMLALARPVHSLAVAPGCARIARKCCHGFDSLVEVSLPGTVADLEAFAFSNTGLKSFEAPASLKRIDEKAFLHCRALERVCLGDGLEVIGDSAFEGTAISELAIPASIQRLGSSVTRHTRVVHSGPGCTLTIDARCKEHFLDGEGGLYRREPDGAHLVQLVDADMETYAVLDGAVAIEPHAFAFHDHITSVRVPSSVRSIGRSAFRVCKALRHVELADSVESIGDEAFFDTNLEAFRVPAALRELGDRALVTFGAHHHDRYPSLAQLEVAPGNDAFFIACGMLCRKTASGASVVAYDGSNPNVVFPEEVTRVEDYAFSNAQGVERLSLNRRLSTIGASGLSTRCWIKSIHVDVGKPVEGRRSFDFEFPNTPGAVRGIALGLGHASWVHVPAIVEQLDICLANARDYSSPRNPSNISAYEQARFILNRLADPFMLTSGARDMMERILRNHIEDICVDVALHDDRSVFDELIGRGYVNAGNLDAVIERVGKLRDAASSAYLLEAKREQFGQRANDYDL